MDVGLLDGLATSAPLRLALFVRPSRSFCPSSVKALTPLPLPALTCSHCTPPAWQKASRSLRPRDTTHRSACAAIERESKSSVVPSVPAAAASDTRAAGTAHARIPSTPKPAISSSSRGTMERTAPRLARNSCGRHSSSWCSSSSSVKYPESPTMRRHSYDSARVELTLTAEAVASIESGI